MSGGRRLSAPVQSAEQIAHGTAGQDSQAGPPTVLPGKNVTPLAPHGDARQGVIQTLQHHTVFRQSRIHTAGRQNHPRAAGFAGFDDIGPQTILACSIQPDLAVGMQPTTIGKSLHHPPVRAPALPTASGTMRTGDFKPQAPADGQPIWRQGGTADRHGRVYNTGPQSPS